MAIDDRSRENEEVDSYNEEEPLSETFGEDIYVHMSKIAPSEGEDGGLEDLDYRASSLSDKIDELNQKLNFLCNECVTREELEDLKNYFLGNGTSIIRNTKLDEQEPDKKLSRKLLDMLLLWSPIYLFPLGFLVGMMVFS